MQLEVILFCAVGIWVLVVLMAVSLCRAAKAGDEAMDDAMDEAHEAAAEEWGVVTPSTSVRKLVLEQAAAELGVNPQTLVAWEDRFGYPRSSPAESGGHRLYRQSDVIALRDALEHGLSIASAVSNARAAARRRRASA